MLPLILVALTIGTMFVIAAGLKSAPGRFWPVVFRVLIFYGLVIIAVFVWAP